MKEAVLKAFVTVNRQGKTIVVHRKKWRKINIRKRQMDDPELKCVMLNLEDGELPKDENKAKELVLGRSLYEVVNDFIPRGIG